MQQGERAVLVRLLGCRFGPLSTEIRERVDQASQPDLECWADRLLEAETLDGVFRDH